jgi:hypothetical protein
MSKVKQLQESDLDNLGSLITIKGTDNCLGDLFVVPDVIPALGERPKAGTVFDSTYGKVPVSAKDADKHNIALSKALIEGLDSNCKVGQCGVFYYNTTTKRITTWYGDLVAVASKVTGNIIEFERKGKSFRGKKPKDSDAVTFTRIY